MKYLLQQSRLQYLLNNRNGYLLLAFCSMLLNIFLAFVILCTIGNERIILIPPNIQKSFWVTNSQVSADYLTEMSLFFANLRLNITPANALLQHDLLLRYVGSEYYNDLKLNLGEERDILKKDHITTAFFPSDIAVDLKHLKTKIKGNIYQTIGETHLPAQAKIYELSFNYKNSKLSVGSFTEVKANA